MAKRIARASLGVYSCAAVTRLSTRKHVSSGLGEAFRLFMHDFFVLEEANTMSSSVGLDGANDVVVILAWGLMSQRAQQRAQRRAQQRVQLAQGSPIDERPCCAAASHLREKVR